MNCIACSRGDIALVVLQRTKLLRHDQAREAVGPLQNELLHCRELPAMHGRSLALKHLHIRTLTQGQASSSPKLPVRSAPEAMPADLKNRSLVFFEGTVSCIWQTAALALLHKP